MHFLHIENARQLIKFRCYSCLDCFISPMEPTVVFITVYFLYWKAFYPYNAVAFQESFDLSPADAFVHAIYDPCEACPSRQFPLFQTFEIIQIAAHFRGKRVADCYYMIHIIQSGFSVIANVNIEYTNVAFGISDKSCYFVFGQFYTICNIKWGDQRSVNTQLMILQVSDRIAFTDFSVYVIEVPAIKSLFHGHCLIKQTAAHCGTAYLGK